MGNSSVTLNIWQRSEEVEIIYKDLVAQYGLAAHAELAAHIGLLALWATRRLLTGLAAHIGLAVQCGLAAHTGLPYVLLDPLLILFVPSFQSNG